MGPCASPPLSPDCSSAWARCSMPSRPSFCRAAHRETLPHYPAVLPRHLETLGGLGPRCHKPKFREQLYSVYGHGSLAAAANRLGAAAALPASPCSFSACAHLSPTPWPAPPAIDRFRTDLYVQREVALFTLGIGDVLPRSLAARSSSSSSPAPDWDLSPSSSAMSPCSPQHLFPPRGLGRAARRQRRITAHLHRTAPPPCLPRRTGSPRRSARRMGALVSGSPRDASPTPFFATTAPSTTTRAGCPPSPPCSIAVPCLSPLCQAPPPPRLNSPLPWLATRSSTSATSSAWKKTRRSGRRDGQGLTASNQFDRVCE